MINTSKGLKLINNITEQKIVELVIEEVKDLFKSSNKEGNSSGELDYPFIPLGVSNRHIHLTKNTFEKLFGAGRDFEEMRPLYQPGEFASKHILAVVGPKLRSIPAVRILGPLRKYDQVEVSLTDAIFLGINPPVVNSGNLERAVSLTLVGPNGSVYLDKCAIIANRHIHMTNKDAQQFGIKEGEYCKVRIGGEKGIIFENVLIRINDSWKLQIHLDTDDANAAYVQNETFVEFIGKM